MRGLLTGVATALLAGALADGLMVIDSGEEAVIYRFGAVSRTATAGLALRAPRPFESDERVAVAEARRVETGERRLLTGDTNLVDLDLVVQYSVSDAVAYSLGTTEPEALVASAVTAAAAELVSTMEVDTLMTTGRAALQRALRERAQRDLSAYGLLLAVVDVRELVPPPAVVEAFNDVSSARGDKETLALSADAYVSQVIPDARGASAQAVERAKARASAIVAEAQGEVARFRALRAAYAAAPEALRAQLRAETLEAIGAEITAIGAPPGGELRLPIGPEAAD